MKSTTKKLFAIILSLIMLTGMAVPALAIEETENTPPEPVGIVAQGKAGDNIDWALDENGVLYLDGKGEMYSYDVWGSSPWYDYHELVTSAVIGEGITTIGGLMFEDCANMTSVSIPNSVTKIEQDAFGWCTGLGRVIIPASVTTIEDFAFRVCENAVIIFEGDAPAFGEYALDFIEFAVYSPERKGWTEELFESLISNTQWFTADDDDAVIAGGEYSENVTWTLTLGGLLTVSGKGEMYNTYGDEEEYIAAWRDYRSLIETAVVEDGITTLGTFAFLNCANLRSVSIAKSVVYIGMYAFSGCDSLETVNIPENVEFISSIAFIGCYSLTDITVDSKNPYYYSDDYGVLYSDYNALVKAPAKLAGEYRVPDGTFGIFEYAFDGCKNLTAVTLPDGLEYIDFTAFLECENLRTVTFLGNAPSIAGDAFLGVTADVYFPEDDPTWTVQMFQSYGGILTWPAYSDEPVGIAHRAEFSMDEEITAEAGDIIDVNVYITDNEGIAAGTVGLYGEGFTILDIRAGDWTDKGQYSANPKNGQFVWFDSEEHNDEGVFAVYTIQIDEDAVLGRYYIIEMYAEDLTGVETDDDGNEIVVGYYYGKYARYQDTYTFIYIVTSISTVPGDFDNDWNVTNADLVILARWLVDLVEPDSDYDRMVLRNGDINYDGEINNVDLVLLARYRVGIY